MAPIQCPGCGQVIEDPSAPCPTCKFQRDPEFKQKLIKFSILFTIFGVLWLLFLTKGMWLG